MDQRHGNLDFSARRAVRPLSVLVVGAGIGGLAVALCMQKTGHRVRILERRSEINEVGAGIQFAPNAARIIERFGLLDKVMEHVTVLEQNVSRRWDNDEELGSMPLVPDVEEQFGMPLAVIHRADLQRVLFEGAIDCGCEVLTDHEAVNIDPEFAPLYRRILVRNNGTETWMSADLIVAADGINSVIRTQMAIGGDNADTLSTTRESAYRFLLTRESVQHDEGVIALLNKNHGVRYLGPGGHIMAYPLRHNELYNVVLVQGIDRDKSVRRSWSMRGKKEDMIEYYRGWSPLVQALIGNAPETEILKTPMGNMPPLSTWVKGHIALAGDACHYMLPYVAQGAANAIEDAGALAMAFTCTDKIDVALELYQQVRKTRSEQVQASAASTGHALHLPDGEEQTRRDESIRAAARGCGTNPDKWNDRKNREFMWGVDVMAETISRFES